MCPHRTIIIKKRYLTKLAETHGPPPACTPVLHSMFSLKVEKGIKIIIIIII